MLISALLLTASVAMLTAVGANSKNTSDVLSETKAYYAAESGLQASINVFRNDSTATYKYGVANPTLASKLAYTTVGGISQVRVGNEAGYSVLLSDPDNTAASTTFSTTGWFTAISGTTVPVANPNTIYIPNQAASDRLEISFSTAAGTVSFDSSGHSTVNPRIGTFQVTKFNNGANTSGPIYFQIDYSTSLPRTATRSIRGSIGQITNASNPVLISFTTQVYAVAGSEIELCATTTSPITSDGSGRCPNVTLSVSPNSQQELYADVTAFDPYRLKILSTGYGPNGAQKKLEGIVERSPLDGLASTSGLTLVGPGAQLDFGPGNGNPTYCGVDPGIQQGQPIPNNPTCTIDPNKPTAPAIGVSDPTGLSNVLGSMGNTNVVPAPAVITDGPAWQQSPAALNDFISYLRTKAQQSGRYVPNSANGTSFQNTNTATPYINTAENLSGQGLTVVDGNANIGPLSGGGILVVTGNLTYGGNFNWRGLIIVTGSSVTRSGAGNGVILGNLVIAPYDPNNLGAGFGSPSFSTNGGGGSDLMFSGYSQNFDGTSAVSDFMAGVAEK